VAGEVKLFVPAPEGGAVAVEELDLGRFELDAVRGDGGGEVGVVGGWRWGLVHEVLLRVVEGLGIRQYRGKCGGREAGGVWVAARRERAGLNGRGGCGELVIADGFGSAARMAGLFMFGVININKPQGWSSRATLSRVERLVRPVKVGHAGTLDPLAEGVLVACLGPATRLIEHVQRMPKEYRATFLLGRRSPSDDVDSEVELLVDPPTPTRAEIEALLPRFTGMISQRPPAFSAVKIDGQRAYKLARRGREVETSLRKVEVYEISLGRYDYPEVELSIRCSSGTYVRSIGRDLAEQLGTAAVMSALVRTAIGPFCVTAAMNPRAPDLERLRAHLQSPLAAVPEMPRLELTELQVFEVQRGGLIKVDDLPEELRGVATAGGGLIAGVDAGGELIALLKEARPGWLKPSPNFLQPA
jgi:tRNA pseudouridine55 synthase